MIRDGACRLPDTLKGRNIHTKVIPTVCNLENMLVKHRQVNGDYSQLRQWEKRSYKAYRIDLISNEILTAPQNEWKKIIRKHILTNRPSDFGASVIDIYLVAYVAETIGVGRKVFLDYIKNVGISEKVNSAQAIWTVGQGDGRYLGILNPNGKVKDWAFMRQWIGAA